LVTVLVGPPDDTLESYTQVFPTATGNGSDAADTTPPEPGVALEVAAWPGAVVDEAAPDVAADVPQPARASPATVARATVACLDRVCLFIYGSSMPDVKEEESTTRVVAASVWLLEHAQDLVSVIVGAVLIVLASAELVSGIVDFFTSVRKVGIDTAGINVLDRVLLVLILIEIVHTVVLSLRAHHLVAQPFIIVGLVAVIRKILVVLSGTGTIPTSQLALLIAMIFVFVAALIAVTWFDRRSRADDPDQEIS
jgi:uncharacterized membrane protein (DUF373 family)